ncbi:WSC-domain-containing protein [Mollisia scopiformis]|uniref:WSC-domain-containing protein n=1 Tax=Mollisia scopiformis TaxID=149040 RepID=A0A132B5C5_MOLSC|nr:WSC-domain-containing protein [Mollisia scopiformis]KUJ07616.1 WSC-domain-containing protein [Mollisia scopiformis]
MLIATMILLSALQVLSFTEPTIPNWTYLACYTDTANRTFNSIPSEITLGIQSTVMTNEVCAGICTGYLYSGTEAGNECFCGNGIMNNGTVATDGRCTSACVGNATENCGGTWGLNSYMALNYVANITGPTTTASGFTTIGKPTAATSPILPSPTSPSPVLPSPTSLSLGPYMQTSWFFDGCFAPNLNTQYIFGISVYSTIQPCLQYCSTQSNVTSSLSMLTILAGLYENVCFCSTSMQAFSLTQDVGGSGVSCVAQCLQNSGVACSGVLAIEVTSLVPLLPLPSAGP